MNKLGIWAIAIVGAVWIGVLSANPVVEAVGGWQPVVEGLDARVTALENQADFNSYWLNDAVPSGEENLAVLCNVGDKIIAGSVEIPGGTASIIQNRPIFDQGANSDQEGWQGRIAGIQGPPSLSVWAHCQIP